MKKFLAGLMSLVTTLGFIGASAYGSESNKPIAAEEQSIEQTQAATAPAAKPAAGEQIKWQVISGGGARGTSTSYGSSGTVGQTAAGQGSSASFKLNQGFWQNFSTSCLCGDADNSGSFTISDAVRLINFIFAGGPGPVQPCLGDADGSGNITVSDAVRLINFIFAGGAAPVCP